VISEAVLAEIRERVDIVALIGEFVRLKKSGVSFKGLCPFHNEKTPSFYVHPRRRFFHCFGCQASGDVFSFLMRAEGISFPEAARLLAARAGVEIPVEDPERDAAQRRERQREERYAAITEAAAGYFISQLDEHPLGATAVEAWRAREIRDETARAFRLGYAPAAWDGLVGFLRQQGWSPSDVEAVGLIVPRRGGSGYYDRFRHRLMFPITDHQGRIVAFSGRLLDLPPGAKAPTESGAKYINSPEGPLYSKGRVLFGLYEGRVSIRREGWVLLCEGNFDLLALHQAGFSNAVAPMGTALTLDQGKLLKRFAERAVLLFDGDAAGRRAVRAAFDVLARVGMPAQVVTLPAGADPDLFLRQEGAGALRARIDAAKGIVEHLIDEAAASARSASDKARAIARLGAVLVKVDNPVEARLYVERIAQKFGVGDVEAVRRQLRKGARGRREEVVAETPPGGRSSPERPLPPLERDLVGVLLDLPGLIESPEARKIGELLTSPELRAIFQAISVLVEERGGVETQALLAEAEGNPALGWVRGRLARPEHEDERGGLEQLRAALPVLERKWLRHRLAVLKREILAAQAAGDDALAARLRAEHVALLHSARKKKGSRGKDGDESSRFEDHGA